MMLLKDISVVKIMTGSNQKKINQENLRNFHVINIPDILKKNMNDLLEHKFRCKRQPKS